MKDQTDESAFENGDSYRQALSELKGTIICGQTVMNMGLNPRCFPHIRPMRGGDTTQLPQKRGSRNYMPSHRQVMAVLVKCFPMGAVESPVASRGKFKVGYERAMESGKQLLDTLLCQTPLRWIEAGVINACGDAEKVFIDSMESLDSIFGSEDNTHTRLCDPTVTSIVLMDVILNRQIPVECRHDNAEYDDAERVVNAMAFTPEDLEDAADFKYRSVVVYLPGAGIFYCPRERRRITEGVKNSPIQMDMSWLKIGHHLSAEETGSNYQFGPDGYVKRFASSCNTNGTSRVSGWILSYCCGAITPLLAIYTKQCSDSDGPRMPPDFVHGVDISNWPVEDARLEYNRLLLESNASRRGGRHYAPDCAHRRLPTTCLIINPRENAHVDIWVDIASVGTLTNRKSLVRVRTVEKHNSSFINLSQDFGDLGKELELHKKLAAITSCNKDLCEKYRYKGTVRTTCKGDVGGMYAIGLKVEKKGTFAPYATNTRGTPELQKAMVESLAIIGGLVFPDVLAVVQDMESDTGVDPLPFMVGADGVRVGCAVDTSFNLGNSSHFDAGDASQGFSVWTEFNRGIADNWYFVMPNLHGIRSNGNPFDGVAVKLHHGVAISWDGRLIRHCTSLTQVDGECDPYVSFTYTPKNQVFGTFVGAKAAIVSAGLMAATPAAKGEVEVLGVIQAPTSRILAKRVASRPRAGILASQTGVVQHSEKKNLLVTTKSTPKLVVPRKVPKDGVTAVLVEDSRKRKHSAIPADSTKVPTMRPKRRTADKQVNLQMTPSREVKTSVVSRKIPPVTNMSGTNTVAAGLDAKCAPVSSRLKSRAATKHAILKMAPTTKAKISVASRTISAVAKMPDKSEIESDSDSDDMCIWTKPQARKQKPPVHGNLSTKRSAVVATSPDRKCPPVPMRPKTGAIAKQVNLPMTHQTKAKSSAQSFSSSLKSPPSGLIPSVAKMPDKTGTDSPPSF